MDQKEFEKISDKYRLLSFGVEFPYIMIPKCTSCVSGMYVYKYMYVNICIYACICICI
jgi:hypothetical protein